MKKSDKMTDALHEDVCNHIMISAIFSLISGRTEFSVKYLLRLKKQLCIERDGLKTLEYHL
jgi:hypothetical protein